MNRERRLVNCYKLFEQTDLASGRTDLYAGGGADGMPERMLAAAAKYEGAMIAAPEGHAIRCVGIVIVDVETGEKWTVTL